jgi:chlorobactene glucosyltransferase
VVALGVGFAWMGLVALLLLRAVRQFRAYRAIAAQPAPRPAPGVTAIVPARNEAPVIGRCLAALIAQDYPADRLAIVVVDDRSDDGTAAAALATAGGDPRVQLVRGAALPAGWMGKPHACWQGAERATGEWLCFMDADTVADPALVGSAVAAAEARPLDLLSLSPRQELASVGERLVMPLGFLVAACLGNLRAVNDPASGAADVNGQFLMIRDRVYRHIGGHRAVRDQAHEDRALAALAKRAGCRIALCSGEPLFRARMYRDWRALWHGGARNLSGMLGGAGATALTAIGALIVGPGAVALPLWIGLARPDSGRLWMAGLVPAIAGSLALAATHLATARYFRIPARYGLLFPLGYVLGAAVALNGALALWRGRLVWKGRVYRLRGA